mmetsp:Transcript_13491/g.38375  ORF Transcript_13491/g.38375 Transcript_13491/m.38375 type:complete len:398 (-) Transcript_13491:79-1272(-)
MGAPADPDRDHRERAPRAQHLLPLGVPEPERRGGPVDPAPALRAHQAGVDGRGGGDRRHVRGWGVPGLHGRRRHPRPGDRPVRRGGRRGGRGPWRGVQGGGHVLGEPERVPQGHRRSRGRRLLPVHHRCRQRRGLRWRQGAGRGRRLRGPPRDHPHRVPGRDPVDARQGRGGRAGGAGPQLHVDMHAREHLRGLGVEAEQVPEAMEAAVARAHARAAGVLQGARRRQGHRVDSGRAGDARVQRRVCPKALPRGLGAEEELLHRLRRRRAGAGVDAGAQPRAAPADAVTAAAREFGKALTLRAAAFPGPARAFGLRLCVCGVVWLRLGRAFANAAFAFKRRRDAKVRGEVGPPRCHRFFKVAFQWSPFWWWPCHRAASGAAQVFKASPNAAECFNHTE